VAGFEPAASTSQMWRDTGLRYTPKRFAKVSFKTSVANIFEKNFKCLYNLLRLRLLKINEGNRF
jgi:hypothetical protein